MKRRGLRIMLRPLQEILWELPEEASRPSASVAHHLLHADDLRLTHIPSTCKIETTRGTSRIIFHALCHLACCAQKSLSRRVLSREDGRPARR